MSMFARLTRLPLRRCLHTTPPSSSSSYRHLRFTLGASAAVAATYLTWRLTSDGHRIALDSVIQPPSTTRTSTNSSALQDPAASLDPENTHTPDPFSSQPEAESSPGSPNSDALNDEVTTGASDPDDKEDASSDAGSSSGAFNPVTGEINWDCPCLGGMAHGPCGPQFREAFSCFVFSEEEPKGINCVEKFKAMQTCFREHPDIYGDEIMDDDEDEESASAPASTEDDTVAASATSESPEKPVESPSTGVSKPQTLQAQKNDQSRASH